MLASAAALEVAGGELEEALGATDDAALQAAGARRPVRGRNLGPRALKGVAVPVEVMLCAFANAGGVRPRGAG